MMAAIRSNSFATDPLSRVSGCRPERTPGAALASRMDLADPEASCGFGDFDFMVQRAL